MCGSYKPEDDDKGGISIPLVRGLLVTESPDSGEVKNLVGRTGIYAKLTDGVHDMISLSLETGLYNFISMDISQIRLQNKWAGYNINEINEIYGLLTQHIHTLFLHHCRILLMLLLSMKDDFEPILKTKNPKEIVYNNIFFRLILYYY